MPKTIKMSKPRFPFFAINILCGNLYLFIPANLSFLACAFLNSTIMASDVDFGLLTLNSTREHSDDPFPLTFDLFEEVGLLDLVLELLLVLLLSTGLRMGS